MPKLDQRLAAEVLERLSEGNSVSTDRMFEDILNKRLEAYRESRGAFEQVRRAIRFNTFSKRRLTRCLKQLEHQHMVVRMTGRGHVRVWESYPRPHWMIEDEGQRYLRDLRAVWSDRPQDTMSHAA